MLKAIVMITALALPIATTGPAAPITRCQPNQAPVRVGWIVPEGVLEDQVPARVYVSYPAAKLVTPLDLMAFELVPGSDDTWQVTYVGCADTL